MHPVDLRSEFQGTYTALRRMTRYIVIHHAAALYPQRFAIEDIRSVHAYHLSKGWPGIGYHRVLAETTNGGSIGDFLVSNPNLQRVHVAFRNHEAYGISCLTNFDSHPNKLPSAKWIEALAVAVAEAKHEWIQAEIVGHRDIALPGYGTACPGSRWHDWKGDLFAEVERVLRPKPPAWHAYETIRDGVAVRTGKSRHYPVAWDGRCILPLGFRFEGEEVKGASYGGADTWVHLRSNDGFVHAKGNVRAVLV